MSNCKMIVTQDRNGYDLVQIDDLEVLGQTFLVTHNDKVTYGTVNDAVLTNVENGNGNLVILTVSFVGGDDFFTLGQFVQARIDAEHRSYVAEVNGTPLEEA